jgi:hypothetical protein
MVSESVFSRNERRSSNGTEKMTVFDNLGEFSALALLAFMIFDVRFYAWTRRTRFWYEEGAKHVFPAPPVAALTCAYAVSYFFAIAASYNYLRSYQFFTGYYFDATGLLIIMGVLMDVAFRFVFFKLKRVFWAAVIATLAFCAWLVAWILMWIQNHNDAGAGPVGPGITTVVVFWDGYVAIFAWWWYVVRGMDALDLTDEDLRDNRKGCTDNVPLAPKNLPSGTVTSEYTAIQIKKAGQAPPTYKKK